MRTYINKENKVDKNDPYSQFIFNSTKKYDYSGALPHEKDPLITPYTKVPFDDISQRSKNGPGAFEYEETIVRRVPGGNNDHTPRKESDMQEISSKHIVTAPRN